MRYLAADWIVTAGKPALSNHVLLMDNGVVKGLLPLSQLHDKAGEVEKYSGILCPGFVNTHCHLELSWARGLIAEGRGLDYFIRNLGELRTDIAAEDQLQAITLADRHMHETGIVAVADIANTAQTLTIKRSSTIRYHTLIEVFGSNPATAEQRFAEALYRKSQFETQTGTTASIVPHSTYSLTEALYRLVNEYAVRHNSLQCIHHQENEDENRFYFDGSGPAAERRRMYFPGFEGWKGTGKRPVESLAHLFDRQLKMLFVHNTVSTQEDISFIQSYLTDPHWCFCPNANLYIEGRLPDIPLFRQNGCKITLGTDSLASNRQLSILEEMKTIGSHYPEIPLEEMIGWATLNGAQWMGIGNAAGSFETGKSPGVVLIDNIDNENFTLKPESTSKLLIPATI